MTRPRLIVLSVIGIAMLYAIGTWVSNRTEWIEYTVPMPAKGEAARNPFYAAQRFAEKLGAHTTWDRIFVEPSNDAVIVLSTWQWSLSANRRLSLQRWVENGGRLVVDRGIWGGVEDFERWSGVVWEELPPKEDSESEADDEEVEESGTDAAKTEAVGTEAAGAEAAESEAAGTEEAASQEAVLEEALPTTVPNREIAGGEEEDDESVPWAAKCEEVLEDRRDASSGAGPMPRRTLCSVVEDEVLRAKDRVEWALQRETGGLDAVRVRVGRGSVTVLNSMPFRGRNLFEGDHGWLFVNATQFKRGDEIHFLSEDEYPGLLALAWIRGWPVVVLCGVVVALLLWRGGVRFGPLIAAPAQARRSLAEQIRGTGEFVLRGGGEAALHAAMVRALEETLRKRVKGFSTLSAKARRDALARAIGDRTRAASLEEAMYGADVVHGTVLRRTLARIEAARRHIIANDGKHRGDTKSSGAAR